MRCSKCNCEGVVTKNAYKDTDGNVAWRYKTPYNLTIEHQGGWLRLYTGSGRDMCYLTRNVSERTEASVDMMVSTLLDAFKV